MKIDFKNIKLIIWDLDDTFWKGTLSEGEIEPITSNIQLIIELTDRGIVNSICSKNDFAPVNEKLIEFGVNDYFVFKSIDWTPKGNRIATLISEMGLRPINTLFIDDNIVNLNEAKFYSQDLLIAEPQIIAELISYYSNLEVSDPTHKRLKQYKVLENKKESKNKYSDNLDFLYSTNTIIDIKYNCIDEIDRIYELIQRTNQLNYTKKRISIEELRIIIEDKSIDTGYVSVKDNFGDYGIVGFFAIMNNKCIHFVFSCRVIGQGVEQYVYSTLDFPKLDVIGEVISELKNIPPPKWINQNIKPESDNQIKINDSKIVFKGPCDMKILTSYMSSNNIIRELTYISDEKYNSIEHHNHSVNYLYLPFLDDELKKILLDDCIFNDKGIFDTAMYDNDVSILFLSTLIEPNLGIYKNKKYGFEIAFAEWLYPLTDENNWNKYINKEIAHYNNDYTLEWLMEFNNKYSFEGKMNIERIIRNISLLLEKVSINTKICFLLGSETPYLNNKKPTYNNRELFHKELNFRLKEIASSNNRILLLDFNDFIKTQNDFLDNINHFQRRVYFNASIKANEYISLILGQELKINKKLLIYDNIASYLKKILPSDSVILKIFRLIYRKLREFNIYM